LRNESQRRQTESLYNAGAALLGFFTGKKRALSSALSSHHRSSSAKDRVGQAEGELEQLQLKMAELASKLESEVADIEAQERAALERIEQRNVRLQRSDIRLVRFGVLWIPVTRRL
jgi:multidrug resistance efflux pump